jgi:thymidylate kinase
MMNTLPKNVVGNPDIVAFVGPDGGGKDWRVAHLQKVFADKAIFWTREPGGGGDLVDRTFIFQHKTELSLPLQLALFFSDRVKHIFNHVFPALDRGEKVFINRSWLCSLAYNVAPTDEHVLDMFKVLLEGLPARGLPGFLVFCTSSAGECRRRATGGRDGEITSFDTDPVEVYQQRIDVYEKLCIELQRVGVRVLRIDTTNISPEENNRIVEHAIREHFGW